MLLLYGTDGCHLCHDAESLLKQAGLTWQMIDIVEDESLLETYGTRIPVLKLNGLELDWPFTQEAILSLISTSI